MVEESTFPMLGTHVNLKGSMSQNQVFDTAAVVSCGGGNNLCMPGVLTCSRLKGHNGPSCFLLRLGKLRSRFA